VRRTRAALVEAFNHLVLRGGPRTIKVADIVAQAKVGRSTFYDHYSGPEAIHMEALARPFALLADAAAGEGDAERLEGLLRHFWENRQRARDVLQGRTGEKAARLLAELVEERLSRRAAEADIPVRLHAAQLAQAALAPVRGWLLGEASCTAEALARSICEGGRRLVRSRAG
jgi:AcrR family transcriptional regulator